MRGSMGVAAPQMGSLLALAKSKHFASCQFSIACKRTGAKQCVQRQQQQRWGKWGKWKRRFRVVLALVFVFAFISISLGACFHFGFTFDLTVSFGLAQFVYLASFLHSTILRSARQKAHKYLCGAKTMRMARRNSTAHLQMNRLMSAGYGGRDVSPLCLPHCFPFALPCLCGKVQATHKLTLNMSI